ncbi:hypothetical protein MYBA111488_24705 [Mycobacterium basiliense]
MVVGGYSQMTMWWLSVVGVVVWKVFQDITTGCSALSVLSALWVVVMGVQIRCRRS